MQRKIHLSFMWQLTGKIYADSMLTGLHQNNVHYCDLITPLPFLISTLHLRRERTLWSTMKTSIFRHPVLAWMAELKWSHDIPWMLRAIAFTACACTSIHRQLLFFSVDPETLMKQKPKCSTEREKSDWPSWVKWSVLWLPVKTLQYSHSIVLKVLKISTL